VLALIFPKKTTRDWLGELAAVVNPRDRVAEYRMLLNNEQRGSTVISRNSTIPRRSRAGVGNADFDNGEVRTRVATGA